MHRTAIDERDLLACCASPAWAARVLAGGPYPDAEAVLRVADAALDTRDRSEIEKALAAHPDAGELARANAGYERVFHAADRPYGLIEGTVPRDDAPPAGPAWD